MTTMIAEIYDALREAGASEERSRAAAEVLAAYNDRFATIDRQFEAVRADLQELRGSMVTRFKDADAEVRGVRGDIRDLRTETKADTRLLQWMLGFLVAGVGTVVVKTLFP